MKIVIDTNVLVGASLSRGGANRSIIRACLTRILLPQIGNALFSEYEDVFFRPEIIRQSQVNIEKRRHLLEAFLSCCEWNQLYFTWRPNLRDEGDNYLVEHVVASGAQYLVTNNVRDFRIQQLKFDNFEVVTPSQLLEKMS